MTQCSRWAAIWLLALVSCPPVLAEPAETARTVLLVDADGQRRPLAVLAPRLAGLRVVYVGEQHDRYDHHLNQLAVLRALRAERPAWAVGLEQVQQQFQPQLDAYVAGRLDERRLLQQIEYFDRWGFDYRLYRPIFRYAREHGVPLVALNVDGELRRKFLFGEELSAAEQTKLPTLDDTDQAYRQRLREVFDQHPTSPAASAAADFERFYRAQLLWDETMAERIVSYLDDHPEQSLLVLAGSGHLAHRSGIPDRVTRRRPALRGQDALLLPHGEAGAGADYLVLGPQAALPAPGRMGIELDIGVGGGTQAVAARRVLAESAAAQAGVEAGDRIAVIDGRSVANLTDLRLALLDKQPGDRVQIEVLRGDQTLSFELVLR